MSENTSSSQEAYFDRDLSWLSFNYRVLLEAKHDELPLYERLKFLAIFSSNLDEFFKVRVASIRSMLSVKKKQRKLLGIGSPKKLLEKIFEEVTRQQEEFGQIFRGSILPELQASNIHLLQEFPTDEEDLNYVQNYFSREIIPYVQPVILMKDKIAHFLRDRALYFAIILNDHLQTPSSDEDTEEQEPPRIYAIVQIPTHYFPRFIQLPSKEHRHTIMFLDDVIRMNLNKIFPGFEVVNAYSIKLSRDADLKIEDEVPGKMVEIIKSSLSKRQVGESSRFLYDPNMPKKLIKYLRGTFDLDKEDLYPGGKYHNFYDFFGFPNPIKPNLEQANQASLPHSLIEQYPNSILEAMREKDMVLHFPYQSYDYVLKYFSEIAVDPRVHTIKTTQYRVASDSAIVNALISAARNGKDVTVFVELKARFDEESNLRSAEAMESAGVKVIYSMPHLKVHAKVAMAFREEEDGNQRAYAFLSTGNFNEKTARIYSDHGLLTTSEALTQDLLKVFYNLQTKIDPSTLLDHLLVAGINIRPRFHALIDREIAHAEAGRKGYILIKLNNLEDKEMIDKLYEANDAGVKIDLIVRGICCLRPGVSGLSEHITVRRIVGRYLEHARVFVFHNDGAEEMFMGSADWMKRNLTHRVEVVFPILDPAIQSEIRHILQLQLDDNTRAVILDQDLNNVFVVPDPENPINCQEAIYEFIKNKHLQAQSRDSVVAEG